jgi:hypothetical protein
MRGPAAMKWAARRGIEFRLLRVPQPQRKRNSPAPSAGTGSVESAQGLMSRFSPMTTRRRLPELLACARCTRCLGGPGHLGVYGIIQSAIALGATVEIIGTAKRAGSVHREPGELALAGSYRDNQP